MKDAKLEFDPIVRAESLMTQETFRQHGDGSHTSYVTPERREQMRDLMMLSIAKSLASLAGAMDARNEYGEGPAEAIGAGIVRAMKNQ